MGYEPGRHNRPTLRRSLRTAAASSSVSPRALAYICTASRRTNSGERVSRAADALQPFLQVRDRCVIGWAAMAEIIRPDGTESQSEKMPGFRRAILFRTETRFTDPFSTRNRIRVLHARAVAPLVVVPGDDLARFAADDLRQRRVEDGRAAVALEVAGDEFLVGVAEDALQLRLRWPILMASLMAGDGHRLFGVEGQIDDRDVRRGHAHGEAVQLAIHLWMTSFSALAAPVVDGIMLMAAARARRRSLCGKSRMTWSLV